MTFTLLQKKEIYKKLPPEVKSFILNNETSELIDGYLKDAGLSEEYLDLADSEILYAMCDLQSLNDSVSNIAKLSGKNINELSNLKIDLENNIFNIIENIKKNQNSKLDNNSKIKVGDIAKKYSLSEVQKEKLLEIINSNIEQTKNSSIFLNTIVSDLGISNLLAEQIIEDLDKRIFEYAINMTQEKKNNKIPEVRPQNLPAVEKVIEKVVPTPQPTPQKVSTPVYTPTYKPVSTVKNEEVKPTSISPSPETPTKKEEDWLADLTEKPFIGKDFGGSKITYKTNSEEIVQKPTTVPRFSLDQVKEAVVPKQNIAENKLNIPTSSTIQPPTPHQEIPKKYSVDPYREPIE
ncbi:MAG: hypothetical protein ABL917_01800 [Parcubacteria group bacterium]